MQTKKVGRPTKTRLTITLSSDTLMRVDRTIDRIQIRNRSHAIEHLIQQSLRPGITTAVILAGGKTDKALRCALAPVGGVPMIARMIGEMARFGIEEFIVCGGVWEKELRTVTDRLPYAFRYSGERSPLGTAGALAHAAKFLPSPFLVIHADILTSLHIDEFVRFHEQEGSLATVAVKPRIAEEHYGKVLLTGNKITDFLESQGDHGIGMVNCGVYIFHPDVLGMIPPAVPSSLERDVLPKLASLGELSAYIFQGMWVDMNRAANTPDMMARWKKEHEGRR